MGRTLFRRGGMGSRESGRVGVGSLLRTSSMDRSPFLLEDQEFHKSIVLIIADDGNASVGLILNKPSSRGLKMDLVDRKTGVRRQIEIPVRFGGQYAIRGQGAVVWLHNNDELRKANVGKNVGPQDGIWTCSQDDATAAISAGIAKPSDFLIVSGLSIWIKGQRGVSDGLQGEVKKGTFEVIDSDKISDVWDGLRTQEILTKLNLIKNLENSYHVWKLGGKEMSEREEQDMISVPVTSGIGEGFDEEDDKLVFKSDIKVSKLSDDAHRSWIATFLLGAPTLGA
jgi:Putative transcriptional regulator